MDCKTDVTLDSVKTLLCLPKSPPAMTHIVVEKTLSVIVLFVCTVSRQSFNEVARPQTHSALRLTAQ